MKQNKTKLYQVCFLSTDDIVSKDKDKEQYFNIRGDKSLMITDI